MFGGQRKPLASLSRKGSAIRGEQSLLLQIDSGIARASEKVNLYGRKRRPSKGRDGIRAALYLRVSTAEQKPDLQYDGLRAYAAQAGLEVVKDYLDVGVSGRREGRPQLNALMTACAAERSRKAA